MRLCEEKQQRRSGVVLIRWLLQRCGLGCGARTSREKQHWRLRGLPSAATAYPRMPLSPSPWGTAGPQNIWENNHFRPTVATETLPFFCPGRLRRQTGRVDVCLVDVCVLFSDVLQNDTSRLISYTLMHHIPKNVMKQEGKEELSSSLNKLCKGGKSLCICMYVYTAAPAWIREVLFASRELQYKVRSNELNESTTDSQT